MKRATTTSHVACGSLGHRIRTPLLAIGIRQLPLGGSVGHSRQSLLEFAKVPKTALRQSQPNRSPRAVSWIGVQSAGLAWHAVTNRGLRNVARHALLYVLRQLRVELMLYVW